LDIEGVNFVVDWKEWWGIGEASMFFKRVDRTINIPIYESICGNSDGIIDAY
jgi:hypothetical protein